MIEVRVDAICDWCGVRKALDVTKGYLAVAEWEAVIGELEERPTSLAEVMDDLDPSSDLQILCPECREHVAWNEDGQLIAVDPDGEALKGARAGESV